MPQLQRSVLVDAAPEAVWAVIGAFDGLSAWHPLLPPCELEGDAPPDAPGAVRVFRHGGEVSAREELLTRDEAERAYTYRVSVPQMPVSGYVGRLAVAANPDGPGSLVTWSGEYEAGPEVVPLIEQGFGDGVYQTGLDALRRRFSA